MLTYPHAEKHFTASDVVRDTVIGMADGLTVPFALAAGLTGAISENDLIVTAGLAEIAAGSIAMGLGGFLAARSDVEHYQHEQQREEREIVQVPEAEMQEVRAIFQSYGLTERECDAVVRSLRQRPRDWVTFMMRFELGLEPPQPGRSWQCGLTIATAYVVGGLIPLSSYIVLDDVESSLRASVGITLLSLAIFGAFKAHLTGAGAIRGSLFTTVVGGLAAGAAFLIARWLG